MLQTLFYHFASLHHAVHDDVSEREMEAFRRVAAESMKGQTDKEKPKSSETKSAPSRRSPEHQNDIPQSGDR